MPRAMKVVHYLLSCVFAPLPVIARLSWPWSWEDPIHTLTWGTSGWISGDPGSGMDSKRELDILIQQDVVYVQGFDFAKELHDDNFTNALKEVSALRAYQRQKGSKKPYG